MLLKSKVFRNRYILFLVIALAVVGILMSSLTVAAAAKKVKVSPTPSPTPTPTITVMPVGPMPNKNVIAYFPDWGVYGGHNFYYVENMPWSKITHVQYAFAKIVDGKIALIDPNADTDMLLTGDDPKQPIKGNFNQLRIFKTKYPRVKVLISIGGWSCSKYFSDVALTDESRKIFGASCIDFIRKYGCFDGIDIDWEYPCNPGYEGNIYRPEDKHNFTLLLKELRDELDVAGKDDNKRYLLTAAVAVGPQFIDDTEPGEYIQYLDFLSLMTYDMNGAWSKTTNHMAPLYANSKDPSAPEVVKTNNADWAVNEFIRLGVPREKLNLGIPYYSRGWAGVKGGINGLFGTAEGGAYGIWDGPGPRAGQNPYYYLKLKLEDTPDWKTYWDPEAQASYLYNEKEGIFYSYDDERSVANKCDYVINKDLGGVIFWEVSADYPNTLEGKKGDYLTNIIYKKFTQEAVPSPTPTPAGN